MSEDNFRCDECRQKQDTLYIGWFRNRQALNPFAKGTVTAGLIHQARVCKLCFHKLKALGLTCAKDL